LFFKDGVSLVVVGVDKFGSGFESLNFDNVVYVLDEFL
jgi:hypothetical protein